MIKPTTKKGRPRPNNLKIPSDFDPKTITLEQATKLLNDKTKTQPQTKKTPAKSTKSSKKSKRGKSK